MELLQKLVAEFRFNQNLRSLDSKVRRRKKKRNCRQRKGRPLLGSKKHAIKLNVRERMHREK